MLKHDLGLDISIPAPPAAVVPPGGGAAVPAPVPPRLAPQGGTWILDEPVGNHVIGEEVAAPAGLLNFGGHGFVRVEGELASVTFVAAGQCLDEAARRRARGLLMADSRVIALPEPGSATQLDVAQCGRSSRCSRR